MHSVIWDVGNVPADTDIIFWGVDGTRQAEPDGFSNVTIDNTFQQSTDGAVKLAYAGNWQSIGGGSGAETDLSEKDSLDGYFNKTLSVTKERGSSVAFTGKGEQPWTSVEELDTDVQARRSTCTATWDQITEQ